MPVHNIFIIVKVKLELIPSDPDQDNCKPRTNHGLNGNSSDNIAYLTEFVLQIQMWWFSCILSQFFSQRSNLLKDTLTISSLQTCIRF